MAHHGSKLLNIMYFSIMIDRFIAHKYTKTTAGILFSRVTNKKVYIRIFAGYNIGV
jgi:hypothetical protein